MSNYNMSEIEARNLVAKLSKRRNRTPEENVVLSDARLCIASHMGITVDPLCQHWLAGNTWSLNSNDIPFTRKRIDGVQKTFTIAQCIWSQMTGLPLDQIQAAKLKINRHASLVEHDQDWRCEVLTTDAAHMGAQRMKVDTIDLPKELKVLRWDLQRQLWFAQIIIPNSGHKAWTTDRFDDPKIPLMLANRVKDLIKEGINWDVEWFNGIQKDWVKDMNSLGMSTDGLEVTDEQMSIVKENALRAHQRDNESAARWDAKMAKDDTMPEPKDIPEIKFPWSK